MAELLLPLLGALIGYQAVRLLLCGWTRVPLTQFKPKHPDDVWR